MNLKNRFINFYHKEIKEEHRHNFKCDMFFQICLGIKIGIVYSFFIVLAEKVFHCTSQQLLILNSLQFITGFSFVIISALIPINCEIKWLKRFQFVSNLFFVIAIIFAKTSFWYVLTFLIYEIIDSIYRIHFVIYKRMYPEEDRPKLMGYAMFFCIGASIISIYIFQSTFGKELFGFPVWKLFFILASIIYTLGVYYGVGRYKIDLSNEKKESFSHFFGEMFKILKEDWKMSVILFLCSLMLFFEVISKTLFYFQIANVYVFTAKIYVIYILVSRLLKMFLAPVISNYINEKGCFYVYRILLICGIVLTILYAFVVSSWVYLFLIGLLYDLFFRFKSIDEKHLIYSVCGDKNTYYQALNAFILAVAGISADFLLKYFSKFIKPGSAQTYHIICFSITIISFISFYLAFKNKQKK